LSIRIVSHGHGLAAIPQFGSLALHHLQLLPASEIDRIGLCAACLDELRDIKRQLTGSSLR
jgi:hypothetical protein